MQIDVGVLPIVAPILALLFLGLGVAAANDRRAGMTGAALGVAGLGALMVLGYVVGEALLASAAVDAGASEAVRSLWSALLGDLRDWNLTLCFAGAIVAGASASLLRPADAPSALRRLQAALDRRPKTTFGQVLRGLDPARAGDLRPRLPRARGQGPGRRPRAHPLLRRRERAARAGRRVRSSRGSARASAAHASSAACWWGRWPS